MTAQAVQSLCDSYILQGPIFSWLGSVTIKLTNGESKIEQDSELTVSQLLSIQKDILP